MPEPTRSRLMQVRSGSVALDEVPEELDLVVGRLERLAQSAELPEAPDREAVDRFLMRAYKNAWWGEPELRPRSGSPGL